jgi:hypothetical protein
MFNRSLVEVHDNEIIYRRIKNILINEENEISPRAFDLRDNSTPPEAYVSVQLSNLCSAKDALAGWERCSICQLEVSIPRGNKLGVQHTPSVYTDPNHPHASISGFFNEEKKDILAINAKLVINTKKQKKT